MAVERGDSNSVLAKRFDNRVHFLSGENKVPRDRRLAVTCWLEIECCCNAHRIWHWHSVFYDFVGRSEEHTSELQSHHDLVCRLLLEKKKKAVIMKQLYYT